VGLARRILVYFTVGYIMGGLTWGLSLLFDQSDESLWLIGTMSIFGALVGGAVAVIELVGAGSSKFRAFFSNFPWFLVGAFLGLIGGLLGALAGREVFLRITNQIDHALFGRVCGMFILGAILGTAIGLVEKLRTGSWQRFSSVLIAASLAGALAGALRHVLTKEFPLIDNFALLFVLFGGLIVAAISLAMSIRTTATLLGHPDNRGPKYGVGYQRPLPADAETWIGSGLTARNSRKTQIKIFDDDLVDAVQACIAFRDDGWYVIPPPGFPEIGEHTYVNGRQIAGPTRLENGSVVTFGKTMFRMQIAAEEPRGAARVPRHPGVAGMILALLLAAAASHAAPPPAASPDWRILCLEPLDLTDTQAISFVFRSVNDEGAAVPLRADALSPQRCSVVDLRGRVPARIVSLEALDPTEPALQLIVALDFSEDPSGKFLQSRIYDDPAPLQELVQTLRRVPGRIQLSTLAFAAEVGPIRAMPLGKADFRELYPRLKRDAGSRQRTELYDALLAGARKLAQSKQRRAIKALFVITDGEPYVRRGTEDRLPELKRILEKKQIRLVVFGGENMGGAFRRLVEELGAPVLPIRPGARAGKVLGDRARMLLPARTATEWELIFAADLTPQELIDPPRFHLRTGERDHGELCGVTMNFLTVVGEREGGAKRGLISLLIVIFILWALIAVIVLLNYLMVRRRYAPQLAAPAPAPPTVSEPPPPQRVSAIPAGHRQRPRGETPMGR
jgi:hypothetical protein